jgi:hypothetical protein
LRLLAAGFVVASVLGILWGAEFAVRDDGFGANLVIRRAGI